MIDFRNQRMSYNKKSLNVNSLIYILPKALIIYNKIKNEPEKSIQNTEIYFCISLIFTKWSSYIPSHTF
jgi:hypothetical protein